MKYNLKQNESIKSLSMLFVNKKSQKKYLFQTVAKTLFCTRRSGSFTVEAAMAVPLFVFLLALFLGLFRVLLVEMQVDQALHYAAGTVAAYSQKAESDAPILEYAGSSVLFYNQLKKENSESQYFKNGFPGILLQESESDNRFVRLQAVYQIRLPVGFFGKKYIDVEQCASARKWNGFQENQQEEDDIWVYVTAYGSVYHKNTSCNYLDLSVRAVTSAQAGQMRNKDGGIYYPCTSCKASYSGSTVYITDYGTDYHSSLGCRKLKRTVYRVKKSEVDGKTPCKKCYGS